MMPAIYFYNQLCCRAIKINCIVSNIFLHAKEPFYGIQAEFVKKLQKVVLNLLENWYQDFQTHLSLRVNYGKLIPIFANVHSDAKFR